MVKCGSPGLVVMGGDSRSEGRGFESLHCILDGHFLHIFFGKNCNVGLKRRKEAGDGPLKKSWSKVASDKVLQVHSTDWLDYSLKDLPSFFTFSPKVFLTGAQEAAKTVLSTKYLNPGDTKNIWAVCCSCKTSCWRPVVCWGWGPRAALVTPVEAIRVGVGFITLFDLKCFLKGNAFQSTVQSVWPDGWILFTFGHLQQ